MKKIIAWLLLLVLAVSLAGCGSKTVKTIEAMEDRIFGYSWTADDAEVLAGLRQEKDMNEWLDSVTEKVAQDQYKYYEVGSLMSCLEAAGIEHAALREQADLCEIRWLVGLKEEAFAAGDWESVMTYLSKVQMYSERLPLQTLMPYEELKSWVESWGGIEPITENGVGGYYDDKQDQYQDDLQIDETLTQKSWNYEFFGDIMMKAYTKENYRPTGEAWEEQLLSKYDFKSVGFYYKEEVIELDGDWIQLHSQGKTTLAEIDGEMQAFLVTPNEIWIGEKGLFTYE